MPMYAQIPVKVVGPIDLVDFGLIKVPLATLERPLWPAVGRGARISRISGGIYTSLIKENMTRSILLEAPDAAFANKVSTQLDDLQRVVAATSRHCKLQEWHSKIVANLIYLRFSFSTGEAAGHNMVTKAADAIAQYIVTKYPELRYLSVSGNYCVDKKVSAVNGILGRGKYVIAEITVSEDICKSMLRTTPHQIVELNIKKNLLGSIINGGVGSANAHFANMLLAFYLATGQDAANIIEGSQGITYAEVKGKSLYFTVTLPNIIVGSIGRGKDLPFVQENLAMMQCKEPSAANKLAQIAAATVLCGELSLMAALTNKGELVRCHMQLER